MTVTTHTYTATVSGAKLSLKGGELTQDAGSWPHVTGRRITVVADPATVDLLDPRTGARLAVTCNGRVFDLGIRERAVSQESGEVSLDLASDEALLEDSRPLADDLTPLTFQTSLRSVVDYVLDKAIPGAHLEPSPAHEGDLTTFSDAENAYSNPRLASAVVAGVSCTGSRVAAPTVDGVGHNAARLSAPTAADSYWYVLQNGSMNGVQEGETWVLSAMGRVTTPLSGTIHSRARRLSVHADVGGFIEDVSEPIPADGTWGRVSVAFTVPTGTVEFFARAYLGATAGAVEWTQIRFARKGAPGTDAAEYFWGGKPDTAGYDYDWVGTPDRSTSRRRATVDRPPELLVWPAGKSAMSFLAPLVQVYGLRLVCDEQRKWTLRDESYTAPDSLTIRYGVNMVAGEDRISRDDETWYDACIVRYRWVDWSGAQQERVDAFALPGATRAVELIRETPYPGPGFAEYSVRRAQGRGREVTASAVSDWRARAEQPVQVDLTGAPTQIGTTQRVTFDLSTDEMQILTRTTDTPAGAIDLLAGTIDALAGTIEDL